MPRLSNFPSAERLSGVVTDTPRTALAAVGLLEAEGSPGRRTFEARAEALYGAGVQVLRLAGTAADITEQVSAQQAVNRREALLQAILGNHRELIYVKDAAGQYHPATESLLRAAVEQAPTR